MPIYEFYCQPCHTVYNFFSRRIDTTTTPDCPHCGAPQLTRQASLFTYAKQADKPDNSAMDPFESMPPAQLEKLLTGMAGEFADVDEQDPKQMARLMRRLTDEAGVDASAGLEEAIARMESGEDPDKIEDDLGAALDGEDPFVATPKNRLGKDSTQAIAALRRRLLPPRVDDTLHDLVP